MSTSLSVLPSLRRVYESLGLAPSVMTPEELDRGLDQLGARLGRLAVEVADATAQGQRLADAAANELDYPVLHRVHVGVRDVLTLSLPPPLVAWAKQVLAGPDSPMLDDFQRGLAALAASTEAPVASRALARLFLFEAVRIHLIVAEHLSGSSIAAVGALPADIDVIAEAEVDRYVAVAAEIDGEVRPLSVLVGAGLLSLEEHVDDLKNVLARIEDDLATAFRVRAALELKLREMDATDAVLIRNAFAPALDEQRLEVERLKAEHPLLLGDRRRDAIDQQVSRLRRRIAAGDWPERKAPALIDLIAMAEAALPEADDGEDRDPES
jgi:hypothetical protein